MKIKEFLGQIFFPRACVTCQISLTEGVICSGCFAAISLHETLFCATCDARIPNGRKTCHLDAPCLVGGAGPYQDPALQELVRQLKFKGIREAAHPLAELVAGYLTLCELSSMKNFIMIPVPLSKQRERERGFNQAEEIARKLSSTLNIPLTTKALTRTRHTKPQTETTGITERTLNVRGCFLATSDVMKKNVLLIDDVTTSGTTFSEAARALRAAGARKIMAIAAAKA